MKKQGESIVFVQGYADDLEILVTGKLKYHFGTAKKST